MGLAGVLSRIQPRARGARSGDGCVRGPALAESKGDRGMTPRREIERLRNRTAAVELAPEEFRRIGHGLVDQLADFLAGLRSRAVTAGETPAAVRAAIAGDRPLPETGSDPASAVADAAELLFDHSLFNGHPRFFGYITSSAMPIGAFGD